MSATIIDGRKVRDARMLDLIKRVQSLSRVPTLAIIQVGDRPDSTAFIRAKKAFAKKVGVLERHIQLRESSSQDEITAVIKKFNTDSVVTGIIVQLPLPNGIDRDVVIDTIDPCKDADGLTSTNVKQWLEGRGDVPIPATARGIRELLGHYNIELAGKEVVVVGRSMLVGRPIAQMCMNANATVTVCHSKTLDLKAETLKGDIIISATGHPRLIGAGHVKKGQIVIDVGITKNEKGELVGDVDFDAIKNIVSAVSPVPGGVGPMTVLGLFENVLDLAITQR